MIDESVKSGRDVNVSSVRAARRMEEGARRRQRDRRERRFPLSVETRGGRDFRTSHIADTWRYAGTQCLYVCVWAGRESEKGEGIRLNHTDLPQGPLGNYREVE